MDTMSGSLSRVGVCAQPSRSPNHSFHMSKSLVARWLLAVHGVSKSNLSGVFQHNAIHLIC